MLGECERKKGVLGEQNVNYVQVARLGRIQYYVCLDIMLGIEAMVPHRGREAQR